MAGGLPLLFDAVTSWERETAIELNYLVPD